MIVLIVISTIAGGTLAFTAPKEFISYSTFFIASYTIMRGLALFLGSFGINYPSEDEILQKVTEGEPIKLSVAFYFYLAFFIPILFLFNFFVKDN